MNIKWYTKLFWQKDPYSEFFQWVQNSNDFEYVPAEKWELTGVIVFTWEGLVMVPRCLKHPHLAVPSVSPTYWGCFFYTISTLLLASYYIYYTFINTSFELMWYSSLMPSALYTVLMSGMDNKAVVFPLYKQSKLLLSVENRDSPLSRWIFF